MVFHYRPLCAEDGHEDGADPDDDVHVDDGDALESSEEMDDYDDDDSSMCMFIPQN